MATPAKNYADRLINAVSDCLDRCKTAHDAVDCAHQFVAQLRTDPAWEQRDADRVERVVMRTVRPIEPAEFRQRA